jgi:hypothetical protein
MEGTWIQLSKKKDPTRFFNTCRYWPTRLLLAQSLLPKGGMLEGAGPPCDAPLFLPASVPLSQCASNVCPLCNVAAAGAWQERIVGLS